MSPWCSLPFLEIVAVGQYHCSKFWCWWGGRVPTERQELVGSGAYYTNSCCSCALTPAISLVLLLLLLRLLPFPALLLLTLLSLSLRPLLWTLPNTMSAPFILCHLITVASQDLRHEQLKYNFVLLYNAILKLSALSKVELIQATSTNAMLM